MCQKATRSEKKIHFRLMEYIKTYNKQKTTFEFKEKRLFFRVGRFLSIVKNNFKINPIALLVRGITDEN